ncbi:MAG: hypothetical protein COW32_01490 [Candidatus Aquicultor secundus]|uniref:type II toxin-antitoxin system Phd/YefM family antitoxin n=1 Tax=Candidatus Aquicultor secundus TaxID=1973895 RepID=UPI000CCA7C76|nr:type II toxin-antitoxin system Phd/YefM family antitoxin [Candidatus Aquicultor secundus]PIW23050.1 MAG: hypothetical protein COW32_01490 [Candidatus Aquicultor secundus]PIY40477.1 MAG: hypothetical protein COZ03_04085 [Candidatus Aquicultor secundus]PJB76488.1 MAG: hypothetical protein CO091_09565 [Candidatus Aquicultor secundus]
MTKTIDAHSARIHFGQVLDEVQADESRFYVKRRGKVAAVIMSAADYADLLDINAEVADSELQAALKESKKQHELGEVGTEEDIFKLLRAE